MASTTPAKTAPKTAPVAKPTEAPATPAVETKPESAASKASRNAPIDFASLSAVKAEAPARGDGAGRKAQDNSVAEGWLRESWSERTEGSKVGGGRAVSVPTAAAGTVASRLRIAARTLKLGLSIKVIDGPDGKSTVNFAAKTPKAAPKTKTVEAPVEAPKTDA